MMRNKKLVIAASLLIVGCGILITVAIMSANRKAVTTATTTAPTIDTSLHITNFSSYWNVSAASQYAIENQINRYLADTNKSASRVGAIRQDSFKTTTDGLISTTVFLVDIPNLKRSYKVSLGSDASTGENSIYILCPASSELLYPPFDCKDDLSEQP